MSDLPKFVVIDGLSFLFRAFHAVRPLSRSDGLPTNALYGFSQMLIKVIRDLQPDYCVVALDSIKPTFRKDMYEPYKAHRSEMDEAMKLQMPYFEPMIAAFDIPGIRVEGVEADDVIATLVETYADTHDMTIVSSDKDLMQLIRPNVTMLDTMKNKRIGAEEVMEKFGVAPNRVTHVQALIGDSSDNVPGVRGIGPKTAAKLMQEFDTLDALYENLDKVDKERLRVSLSENRNDAEISHKLVTLKCDVEIPDSQVSKDSLRFSPEVEKAQEFLRKLELNSLVSRLADDKNGFIKDTPKTTPNQSASAPISAKALAQQKKVSDPTYELVTTKEQLTAWCDRLEKCQFFAFDTETTSLDAMQAELVGISLSDTVGNGCYIPLTYRPQLDLTTPVNDAEILDKAWVFEQLTPLLSKRSLTKVGHNVKYDLLVLKNAGVDVSNMADTMVMSAVLYAGLHNHAMDDLAERYLDHTCISYKEVCGTGKNQLTFDQVPLDQATKYAAEDADITLRLYTKFLKELKANETLYKLYKDVEEALIPTLTDMEFAGVKVDQQHLHGLSEEFGSQISELEKTVHSLAGQEFNLNSPKQMSAILFEEMGLKVNGKVPKSTNVTVMEKLAADDKQPEGQKIATQILEYRQLAKLRSTYTESLQGDINPHTGRVHTSYNQTGASTGRFSSSNPNLQNIPIRTENGRRIRQAFIAEEGNVLLAADYSQIELRLLAHFSENGPLMQAFHDGVDIHRFTAGHIFEVPYDAVDSDQRRIAKTINFGLIYGMGPVALSRSLGITRNEASTFIARYFARFEGLKDFLEGTKEFAAQHGYVETLMGRRIHTPDINSSQPMFKAGAERAAMNAPLQGSNADIIKKVMPEIHQKLAEEGYKAKLLMQVHDELVFEVPKAELEKVDDLVKTMMENTVSLRVPLLVESGFGPNWEDAH
jgi:DNA polymerase-1